MTDEKRGGPPPRGGPGGGNREGRPGGGGPGGGRRDDKRGGPRKGGFGKGGPAKPERRETYENLALLTRGEGFRIDKFTLAEKGTHRPVKVEYRLTREGLKGVHSFPRLVDAQAAATAELPEPEPEIVEEVVEAPAEGETDTTEGESAEAETAEHVGEEAPAEDEAVDSVPAEEAAPEAAAPEAVAPEAADSVEHVATDEAAG
jgi:hypothetical protein